MNRRSLLTSALLVASARGLPLPAWISPALAQAPAAAPAANAQEQAWRHGVSLFGDLKYPPGFKQFDYVNANAPKGGTVRRVALGTFDNFNTGVAGVKGTLAAGCPCHSLRDAAAVGSLDEVSSEYGLLAEAVSYPGRFLLGHLSAARRSEMARRQAGDAGGRRFLLRCIEEKQPASMPPITATSPRSKRPAIARSPSRSTGRAIANCRRSSASSLSCRSIGGKAPTRTASKRDIAATHARAAARQRPLSHQGFRRRAATSSYERVKDYWGKDLNVNVGVNNFDLLRFDYFRDTTVALEAFQGR